ncbi:hypothetical protein [Sphingobium sp.]|jgi:hypothetical protein|uniref:hypothetical protein n=1 Tax=Sphingobium sp. TaxID=1912891 RepID=UPI003BB7ACA7
MPQIFVPLSTALEIMGSVLGVKADTTLKSRVRAITDMGVPRAGRDKAHQRLRYGLTELSEMTLVLLLTDAGIAPSTAARLVREGWADFAPAAFEACRPLMPPGYSGTGARSDGPIAVVGGARLREAGKQGTRREREVGELPHVDTSTPEVRLGEALGAAAIAVVVNAPAFMPTLVNALVVHAVVPQDLVDSFIALRDSEDDGR